MAGQERSRATWGRRLRRLAVRLGFSVLLGLLLLEGFFRAVVHVDALSGVAAGLRQPRSFAPRWEDEFWKLDYLFGRADRTDGKGNDPVLGWRSERVLAGTYEHRDRGAVGVRRPVLLYGDSFAYCFTRDEDCWQGLLDRSSLGSRYALLNYGSNGFGLDQMWLLYQRSIDLYAGSDPVVVVAILVDDDFDRCLLHMRGSPKPYFTPVAGDRLVLHPPEGGGRCAGFLAEHPLDLGWYTLRYVLYGTDWVGGWLRSALSNHARAGVLARQISRCILREWKQDLDRRGLEYFVLLFHKQDHVSSPRAAGWREEFAVGYLTQLGMPFVSSKLRLIADARAHGRGPYDYFLLQGPGLLHYNELGNEVVFDCFTAGLQRRFDSSETVLGLELAPVPGR